MKKFHLFFSSLLVASLFFSLYPLSSPLFGQNLSLGLSISDGKVKSFYLSISSYFHVPEPEIIQIRERYRLAEEELPVVFFLATRAKVEPAAIIELRLKGMSWWDITLHFGLNPEIFFVPVTVVKIGPPYGKAFGYYRQYRERKTWGKIVLTDADVVNLVNLKFVSEYHQLPPEKVMEMRARGQSFIDIHETIIKEKGKGRSSGEEVKAKAKGKGRKK